MSNIGALGGIGIIVLGLLYLLTLHINHPIDCITCENDYAGSEEACPQSKRRCGHHCNHSWSHEICCWCRKEEWP